MLHIKIQDNKYNESKRHNVFKVDHCIGKFILHSRTLEAWYGRRWGYMKANETVICESEPSFRDTFNDQGVQRQVPWLLIDHEWVPW